MRISAATRTANSSMLRSLLRAYRALVWSLTRYYRRRGRRRLTPEQEVDAAIARLNREQQALRRLSGRR